MYFSAIERPSSSRVYRLRGLRSIRLASADFQADAACDAPHAMLRVRCSGCDALARERHPIDFFLRGLPMCDHLFGNFAQ